MTPSEGATIISRSGYAPKNISRSMVITHCSRPCAATSSKYYPYFSSVQEDPGVRTGVWIIRGLLVDPFMPDVIDTAMPLCANRAATPVTAYRTKIDLGFCVLIPSLLCEIDNLNRNPTRCGDALTRSANTCSCHQCRRDGTCRSYQHQNL